MMALARAGIWATGAIATLAAIIVAIMLLTAIADGQSSSSSSSSSSTTTTTPHAGCHKVPTGSNVVREITDYYGNTIGQLIEFTGYWDCSSAGGTADTTDLVRWRLWFDAGPGNY